MDRFYSLSHSKIPFYFKQSIRDFVVEETPLYPFSGEGEHMVLHVRKKNLSTWEMIDRIANHLGIKAREIGYAGLKDKNAMTKQYISLLKKYEPKLESFSHDGVKILSRDYHGNKIRMGHLKGNRFFIRLKKVTPVAAQKIDKALAEIAKNGMPNYFGYQRFGADGENYKKGGEILRGERKERNVKMKRLYVNAYQSHLFNLWLSRRIEMNTLFSNFSAVELTELLNLPEEAIRTMQAQTHPFKLFEGDVIMHYPHGRLFHFEGDSRDLERFSAGEVSPSGLLCGQRAQRATGLAEEIEKDYDDDIAIDGARRYAWIFPQDVEGEYKEDDAWYELHFTLPKGSYATVLIEEIAKRPIQNSEEGY